MSKIEKYFNYILVAIVVVGICMLFLPCGTFSIGGFKSENYSGMQMIFGYQNEMHVSWNFNFIGLAAIILLVIGCVASFFNKKMEGYGQYIAGGLILVGAILYFLSGYTVKFVQEEMKDDFVILFPLYLGTALCVLSGICFIFKNQLFALSKKNK